MSEDSKKPSIAALLVGKMGPKVDGEGGDDDGAHACAQDIIDAVHAKDHVGLAAALKDFAAFHSDDGEDEEPSRSGEPGNSGAAAKDPNRGYSAFKK